MDSAGVHVPLVLAPEGPHVYSLRASPISARAAGARRPWKDGRCYKHVAPNGAKA